MRILAQNDYASPLEDFVLMTLAAVYASVTDGCISKLLSKYRKPSLNQLGKEDVDRPD